MKDSLYSIFYMFVISLCFAALVSAVKVVNDQRIEQNQKIKLQKIILNVLGMPVSQAQRGEDVTRMFDQRVKTIDVEKTNIYVGYQDDGKTILGYAFPVGGPGFWGPIYGMVGVNADASQVLGIAFYKHSETPGLGGRISEAWFQKQFKGLKLHPIEGDKKIFYLKAPGSHSAPNELDAITGATNTSAAVQKFVNRDLDHFLKDLWGKIKAETKTDSGQGRVRRPAGPNSRISRWDDSPGRRLQIVRKS